ncbi:MAG TPA: hypothetical protein DCG72_13690 [Gammaproteobacteria bacterium]|nr:hypothetical protein [Gammaproteobacteria bacterium]
MNIPKKIYAGTTIKWRDDSAVGPLNESITSADWTLTYYLRTNTTHEGHTVAGTSYGTGWEFTISATDSAGFDSGDWFFYAEASKGSEKFTLGNGQLEVLASLSYTGQPGAFDGRTQAEKDRDEVTAAIRAIIADKAAEYSIGNRTFKRVDLAELRTRESQLNYIVNLERRRAKIANGLGDPFTKYVRF